MTYDLTRGKILAEYTGFIQSIEGKKAKYIAHCTLFDNNGGVYNARIPSKKFPTPQWSNPYSYEFKFQVLKKGRTAEVKITHLEPKPLTRSENKEIDSLLKKRNPKVSLDSFS